MTNCGKILKLLALVLFGEDGDGSGGMNAICSRPEVADDVISGEDVETLRNNSYVNLWVASFSSFQENRNQPLHKRR